eukprot:256381-Prymnesium_polylepis.1
MNLSERLDYWRTGELSCRYTGPNGCLRQAAVGVNNCNKFARSIAVLVGLVLLIWGVDWGSMEQ